MITDEDFERLLRAGAHRDAAAAGDQLERVWERVSVGMQGQRATRPPRRFARVPLLAAAVLVLVAATAVAAVPEVRERLGFGAVRPAPEISSIETKPASITDGERIRLEEQIGQLRSATGNSDPAFKIGELSEPRVMLDEDGHRILATQDEDGNVCISASDTGYALDCSVGLSEAGVLFSMRESHSASGAVSFFVAGIASDRVDSLVLITDDGEIPVDHFSDNAFYWEGTSRPTAIKSVGDLGANQTSIG